MPLDFIENCNTRAERLVDQFRSTVCMRLPNSYDKNFYNYRFNNPFFGYVKVENDCCLPFYMLTNNDDLVAQHYFWYGRNGYERASVREWVMRAQKASVVLDVGAHTGLFALLACRCNPDLEQVVAFEPTGRANSRIYENLIINSLVGKVRVEQKAISDKTSVVTMMHYEDDYQIGTGSSFLGTEKPFSVTRRETCEAIALDDYIATAEVLPDLIKIDVEGAEIHALRGAKRLISKLQTTFLIEVLPTTAGEVAELLSDYELFIIDDESNEKIPYDLSRIEHYTNILAVPPEV